MRILYLIPARKGSKGLPGKNTKLLGDKPLIEYSIDFALNNLKNDDVLCISTNDEAVITIAESKGITIPFIRPDELANDNASSHDVIIHAINQYEKLNQTFDAVLLLQPTSPFRIQDDFTNLIKEYSVDTDMVVSVKLAKENPYFTLFEENSEGFLNKSKIGNYERRQDCPEVYAFNGSMYLINIESIKKSRIAALKYIKKIIMPEERSVDIDTLADWTLAEFYLKNENS
ncbi:cytidylyltransferase domain-containing protein [Flavobacterium sp.]|jgi:N-acylneuraminate cytidylyltransferase|uniref:acylneuraminate cytidylyltransferase family protein n=1 Tax=Flavobacterium sp. TaxID=239 RepID=UPI0037BF268B